MTFKQYCKIEANAGGMSCNNRQFIKACIAYVIPQARHHHLYRKDRHEFIRQGLSRLSDVKVMRQLFRA